jgi:uncharacterized protein YhaN
VTADRSRFRDLRDRANVVLAAGLARLGAHDLDDVRARHGQTRERQAKLDAAVAELHGLVPKGLASLARDVETRREGLSSDLAEQVVDVRDDVDGAIDLALLQANLKREIKRTESLRPRLEASTTALTREEVNLDARRVQQTALIGKLPPRETWGEVLKRLSHAVDTTRSAAHSSVLEVAALREVAPSEDVLSARAQQLATSRHAQSERAREIGQLELKIAELRGVEAAADETGPAHQVEALEGELERAIAEVNREEAKVASLLVLDQVLGEVEQEDEVRYLAPVTLKVAPYLAMVFPEEFQGSSDVVFGSDLSVKGLQRKGRSEILARLSGGTQEQIAVLVRLGFGHLLAESGQASPVILDDALVYCDDERLARVFAALDAASQRHQVIVLSCRASAFQALGGHRAAITPWRTTS